MLIDRSMSESVEAQLDALRRRMDRVEDELAVHRLIVRYGLAVDAGDAEAAMELFTRDTLYEIRAAGLGRGGDPKKTLVLRGRAAVGEMVRSDDHQELLPNAAHTIGPAVVHVEGEKATATGYTRIYHREGESFRMFRMAVNHWELVKQEGHWRVHRRYSQVLGESDVQDLMRRGLEAPAD